MNTFRVVDRAAASIFVALVAGACGASAPSTAVSNVPPPASQSTSTMTPAPTASALPAATFRNPFTVVGHIDLAALGIGQPIAFAIGKGGNLYISDTKPEVVIVSPDGTLIDRWGRAGSKPGEFAFEFLVDTHLGAPGNLHGSIAIGPAGEVFVSDAANDRVQVFTPAGTFVRAFGELGDGSGLESPFDIAVDAAGVSYVTDDAEDRFDLRAFDAAGALLWIRIGGPYHLSSIDSAGRIVATHEAGEVVWIAPDGKSAERVAFADPCDAVADGRGYSYVQDCGTGWYTVLGANLEKLGSWDPGAVHGLHVTLDGTGYAFAADGSIVILAIDLP